MPGKQMSIEADQRAGAIDQETARARRNELSKESQLYGAMDGAMKFVKGDAIAGLIMTAINIVGGICVGVFMNGKEVGWAITKYGILTIGDGLVSQIPALLVSITSGVIVTRVGDVDNQPLGQDIINQFFAQPKAILLGSGHPARLGDARRDRSHPRIPENTDIRPGGVCGRGRIQSQAEGQDRRREGREGGGPARRRRAVGRRRAASEEEGRR